MTMAEAKAPTRRNSFSKGKKWSPLPMLFLSSAGGTTYKATRRRRGMLRALKLLALLLTGIFTLCFIALLAAWYPGDETIRSSSEGPLRLMFSRSGVSFGTRKEIHFSAEVKIDAGDTAIRKTTKGYTVQGKIAKRPRWSVVGAVYHVECSLTRSLKVSTTEPIK
jgi:hypothetical protein